jgi:plastocyanin
MTDACMVQEATTGSDPGRGCQRRRLAAVAALGLGASLVAPAAAAQGVPLSVELLAGTCAQPGPRVAAVADAAISGRGAIASQLMAVYEALGGVVAEGEITVGTALVDIASSEHAIGVRSPGGEAGAGPACGELGAFELHGGDVQVGLGRPDGLGQGVAWLHDNGDGTTTVSVFLTAPAPSRSPAVAQAEVAIVKSVYGPDPLHIRPGTTVTWVNRDRSPHTTTAEDLTFDSGYLAQGATWSRTFETPGTYAYFCVYHPRMRGTIVVE